MEDSFYSKAYSPFSQAAVVAGFSAFCIIVSKLVEVSGVEVEANFAWLLASTFIMFFALFNSVISLSAKDSEVYYRKSLLSFAGLMGITGALAWFCSGNSLGNAETYQWIFIVLGVVYVVFLSMMGFMKRIVEFAQREEWNHPRIRNNQNKKRNRR